MKIKYLYRRPFKNVKQIVCEIEGEIPAWLTPGTEIEIAPAGTIDRLKNQTPPMMED